MAAPICEREVSFSVPTTAVMAAPEALSHQELVQRVRELEREVERLRSGAQCPPGGAVASSPSGGADVSPPGGAGIGASIYPPGGAGLCPHEAGVQCPPDGAGVRAGSCPPGGAGTQRPPGGAAPQGLPGPQRRGRSRQRRPFDFSAHGQRHVALRLCYLGWDYQGFAAQDNTSNTVEDKLFQALIKTRLVESRHSACYHRSGRTDKGVSAFGQVISLDLRSNLSRGLGVKHRDAERGRDTEIDIDTQGDRSTERDRDTESDISTERDTERHTERDTKRDTNRMRDRERHTDRVSDNERDTNRMRDRVRDTEGDRNTERDTGRERDTEGVRNTHRGKVKQRDRARDTEKDIDKARDTERETEEDKNTQRVRDTVRDTGRVGNTQRHTDTVRDTDTVGGGRDRCGELERETDRHGEAERDREPEEIHYVQILNRVLPPSIRVLSWSPVGPGFSARFSCWHRTYRYLFPRSRLDLRAMTQAAGRLRGTHDFRNLCKMDVANGVVNFTRTVLAADIRPARGWGGGEGGGEGGGYELWEFRVRGQAFLYHQVRCMMAILLLVGRGLETPDVVDKLLDVESNPRKPQYSMAVDYPLILDECVYSERDVRWETDPEALAVMVIELQRMWTSLTIRSQLLFHMLERLNQTRRPARGASDDDGDDEGPLPWSLALPSVSAQDSGLLQGVPSRSYKRLMDRPLCEGLESRINHYTKRGRISGPLTELPPCPPGGDRTVAP